MPRNFARIVFAVVLSATTAAIACKPSPPPAKSPWPPDPYPLLDAIRRTDLVSVRTLLDAGADPNYVANNKYTTPLVAAVQEGSVPIVRLLIARGANMKQYPHSGLINLALKGPGTTAGKIEMIVELVARGADPNSGLRTTDTPPLAVAAEDQDETVLKALLTAGADPNIGEPACAAARLGRTQAVALLLDAGAKTTCPPFSLLEVAIGSDSLELVQHLVHGRSLRNGLKEDPVFVRARSLKMAEFLIRSGAEAAVNRTADYTGYTGLHSAAENVAPDLLRYYIKLGMDVNARNSAGDTPLHVLVRDPPPGRCTDPTDTTSPEEYARRLNASTEILLSAGARPELRNKGEQSAIDVARNDAIKARLRTHVAATRSL